MIGATCDSPQNKIGLNKALQILLIRMKISLFKDQQIRLSFFHYLQVLYKAPDGNLYLRKLKSEYFLFLKLQPPKQIQDYKEWSN